MQAAVYDGNDLKLQEVPKPGVSNTQVLIKVKAVGICGTDFAIVDGTLPTTTPIIIGHEFSGKVVEIGEQVDKKWLGKRVTSEINSNIDFDCFFCQRNLFTQCISRKALGIDINGALADFIAVESYLIHKIPANLSYEEATFIEPLAAAFQTFEMMPLEKDDHIVAIFGLGKLGLLLTQVALLKGLDVIVIDRSAFKLEIAKGYGAHHLINHSKIKDVSQKIKDVTNSLGADIVIDSTGNPEALKTIIKSCRTRGKIHIKSTHGIDTPLNLTDIVVREITLYSSRCGPFEKAIKSLKAKKIKVKDLISQVLPLREIKTVFLDHYDTNEVIKRIFKI